MPQCKNDPKRKYKGDEPSPKGLGWCAHGEKEGEVRKGRDGNKWIVKKVSSGSLRWVKVVDKDGDKTLVKKGYKKYVLKNDFDNKELDIPCIVYIKNKNVIIYKNDDYVIMLISLLSKRLMYGFFDLLSGGYLITLNNNNKVDLVPPRPNNTHLTIHQSLSNNKNIKVILWSGMSSDFLIFFIDYIIGLSNKYIIGIITSKNIKQYIMRNYKIFLIKQSLHQTFNSDKDYVFKSINWSPSIDYNIIYNKINKSKIIISHITNNILQQIS